MEIMMDVKEHDQSACPKTLPHTDFKTEKVGNVLAQFVSETGEVSGHPFDLPISITFDQLQAVYNAFHSIEKQEAVPLAFFARDKPITESLSKTLEREDVNTEKVLDIIYQPQAIFRVRAVTRCTSSLPGHSEAVISAAFSPDGRYLASGSGDTTIRFWDINTETPHFTCSGHKHWVLSISWSPDGRRLASGCRSGQVMIWNPKTGKQIGKSLVGHKQWITALAWEPLHRSGECRRMASSSKDGDVHVWDVTLGHTLFILSGHQQSVTCLRWGGAGLLFSGSQDRSVRVWRDQDGVLCRTLQGHAHWVNTLALNTDYVMRTGAFDPAKASIVHGEEEISAEELQRRAGERYAAVVQLSGGTERLVSGSDDFTMILWTPENDKKPVARMTGHQQLINDVKFSPDSRLIASASFDKSVKLWESKTGKFVATLRGHVQAVYQIAWSADSRLLVSGSADSTLKVWSMKTKKLELDLPGHADEVFAVDWSPDGQRVVSGGKDKVLKIWRH